MLWVWNLARKSISYFKIIIVSCFVTQTLLPKNLRTQEHLENNHLVLRVVSVSVSVAVSASTNEIVGVYGVVFKTITLVVEDEVNQVLTTNLWLEMQWFDYRLMWDPGRWGKIRKLHVPVDQIWIPDILLYNKWAYWYFFTIKVLCYSADGEPHITIMSDAIVYYNGLVVCL